MPSYSEKRKLRLVPLEGYNPARPPIIRMSREEANRHQSASYLRFLRRQSWRTNLITVDGEQPYTQKWGELKNAL